MTSSNITKDLPNTHSRSTAETTMNPIGQTIPVIHPHLEGKPKQLCTTTTVVMLGYNWWLCRVINIISVQYNGGFLPDIILLTQGYYHWGTRLNTM